MERKLCNVAGWWVCACLVACTQQPGSQPAQVAVAAQPPQVALNPSAQAGATGQAAQPPEAGAMPMQTPEVMAPGKGLAGDKNHPLTGPGKRANDPEYCTERRVSYSRPCHDDPDPCRIKSGWNGDEFCWPAPAAGEGIQIHIGPKDYNDPAEVAKYVIEPGSEFNNTVIGHVPLTEERFYNRVMVRMRPGSHHWLSEVIGGQPTEGFYEGESSCYGLSDRSYGTIGGGQTLIYDNPPGGIIAPENAGIGSSLPANSSVCMNLHAYNYAEKPQMREMWINVYFTDKAKVTQPTEPIVVIAGLGLSVPPGGKQELTYTQEFAAPGRIIQLWGHRHAWTPRFAVWLNDGLIYDSWDWRESVVFNYDSITKNPMPQPDAKLDGASSGPLAVKQGDKLKFSCFIENESDQMLVWRNELYGGEMCNLWGTTVGDGTGLGGSFQ